MADLFIMFNALLGGFGLVILAMSALLTAWAAWEKGYSPLAWAIWGLLAPVISLLALAAVPVTRKAKCPHCLGYLPAKDARVCMHCGRDIAQAQTG